MKHRTACMLIVLLSLAPLGCGDGGDPSKDRTGPTEPNDPKPSAGFFTEVTQQLGLPAPTVGYAQPEFFTTEITPGGVALFDYDNDGDLDIYQVRHAPPGRPWSVAIRQPAPNRLFRNDGDRFVEVEDAAGLNDAGFGHGCAIGDIDNDGDLDVYVTNYGTDALCRNDGDGTFTNVSSQAGIVGEHWSSAASFFDYDRDGLLDLFVVHFAVFDPLRECKTSKGELEYCGPHTFPGVRDTLYRNNGDGTFSDVSDAAGINVPARGWGVITADITGDGFADIYVANDEEPNLLWVNDGTGKFKDEALARGCATNGAGRVEASMGVTLGDLNGDGRRDLFMTHISGETNTLYLSSPAPGVSGTGYSDKSAASGASAVDLPYTGWGCGFVDFDHDGDLDLAVANGKVARAKESFDGADVARLGETWAQYAEPNLLFRNDGDGKFTNVSAEAGDFTRHVEVTRGLAFGDIDNDGDIDLVTNDIDHTLRVYRNDAPARDANWLMVRALDRGRDAIGAEVTLVTESGRRAGLVLPSYSYLSSNDPRVHFGLGGVDEINAIEVTWADGKKETFAGGAVNRFVTVERGKGN